MNRTERETLRVVGLMSGTSVDGIDAVLAEIGQEEGRIRLVQRAFCTLAWPGELREQIFRLFTQPVTAAELCRANFQLGALFAQAALTVMAQAGLEPEAVHLIGSHGQTVWHDVDARGRVTSTLQLGEAAVIAEETGVTTVADFRVADVAAGGQGAPLVAIFDWLILRPPPRLNGVEGGWRAVQNIGGIGNVTFLPPEGTPEEPLAFDTGPGNVLLDWAVTQATDGRQHFDRDGALARQGRVHQELLARWLSHPYFQQPPPKTTGRELFGPALGQAWLAEAQAAGLSTADFVATLTELTAASIAQAYARFAPGPVAQVVVGGGGGHNPVLLERLAAWLERELGRPVPVIRHRALGIDDDAKEALAFALLAYLAWQGRPGNLPSCTGARGPRILGKIVQAPPAASVIAPAR